jgi:serine phosphatase RsbU (regulator of sigma subunit)
MFPRNAVLRLGRYEVAVRYRPAAEWLGGDWYDARLGADGSAIVVVGDVAGHGLRAAAGMVRICSALRGLSVTGLPANWLLCYLNRLICSDECPDRVASAVVCVLDQECPALLWAQAGHPPPVLISGGAARLLNPPRGLLLGVDPAAGYSLGCEEVMPGDILLLYTDGLIERRGQDITDGLDALLAAVTDSPPSTAAEAADAILTRFASPLADDDICLVAIQVG